MKYEDIEVGKKYRIVSLDYGDISDAAKKIEIARDTAAGFHVGVVVTCIDKLPEDRRFNIKTDIKFGEENLPGYYWVKPEEIVEAKKRKIV